MLQYLCVLIDVACKYVVPYIPANYSRLHFSVAYLTNSCT